MIEISNMSDVLGENLETYHNLLLLEKIYGVRAIGHTHLMMHGVVDNTQHKQKVIVLVENKAQSEYILEQYKLPRTAVQFITYNDFERLRGIRKPIAIDNSVMSRLLRDVFKLIHHLLRKIIILETQLEKKWK